MEIKKAKIIFSNELFSNKLIKYLFKVIFIHKEIEYVNKNFIKTYPPPTASNVHFLLIKYAYNVPTRNEIPLEIFILILKFKRMAYAKISSKTVLIPEMVNLLNSTNNFFKITKKFYLFI